MSQITTDMKAELQKSLTAMQTLRDEIRVQLHLAGMDAKDAWAKLEPKVEEAEKLAEEVSDASKAAVADVLEKLRELRSSLQK